MTKAEEAHRIDKGSFRVWQWGSKEDFLFV